MKRDGLIAALSVVALASWLMFGAAIVDSAPTDSKMPPSCKCDVKCVCGCDKTGKCGCTKEPPLVNLVEQDLNGVYQSRSQDGDDKIYHGAVTIQRRRDLYFVHWLTRGNVTHGFGIRQGDTLSVHWWMGEGEKHIKGITVYKIERDKLVGKWGALPSDGRLKRETLFWLKALEPLPEPEAEAEAKL